jgi:hypothetical protein
MKCFESWLERARSQLATPAESQVSGAWLTLEDCTTPVPLTSKKKVHTAEKRILELPDDYRFIDDNIGDVV